MNLTKMIKAIQKEEKELYNSIFFAIFLFLMICREMAHAITMRTTSHPQGSFAFLTFRSVYVLVLILLFLCAALDNLPEAVTSVSSEAVDGLSSSLIEVVLSHADLQRFGVSLRRVSCVGNRAEAVLIEPANTFHQASVHLGFDYQTSA
jgi:hypothetical protein